MKKNFYHTREGQTILEVLIALTLIILFLSGVIAVELISIKNAQFAQNKSIATKLARQQLERARVIRDTAGIDELNLCTPLNPCWINSKLTPVQVLPTGTYEQKIYIENATEEECPAPSIVPAPITYKAVSYIGWGQGALITPPPDVTLTTCITDWR